MLLFSDKLRKTSDVNLDYFVGCKRFMREEGQLNAAACKSSAAADAQF